MFLYCVPDFPERASIRLPSWAERGRARRCLPVCQDGRPPGPHIPPPHYSLQDRPPSGLPTCPPQNQGRSPQRGRARQTKRAPPSCFLKYLMRQFS
ncbi:hypothetical protein O3P69_001741 [Scylla paramamosain]|uniref:Uncharacterized protein n=1 Tax=Scylla paramamosain TaxID=85552 RepID=A0AAW0UZ68_SCYPA